MTGFTGRVLHGAAIVAHRGAPGAGYGEVIRVLRCAERSADAGDADQGAFGVGEVTDDKTIR